MNSHDVFYFYNASINPVKLIEENVVNGLQPTEGYLTNAFGVLIDPKFFPGILKGREGTVEEIPIPANWHADIAEFGAALRAVELARNSFTMVELGCGWGCWMNITGITAKRKGLTVHLIGVEGDEGHVDFAREALRINGFEPGEYHLYHGVAAATDGVALFPKDDQPGLNWGGAPKFDVDPKEAQRLVNSGAYIRLEQFSLKRIFESSKKIDLLHVDIQGGEARLISQSLPFLSDRVAYLLIGTHSRQIEGILFDCLLKGGWVLEIERPALLNLEREPSVTVDGVQAWRNPRLLPNSDIADATGSIRIVTGIGKVKPAEEFWLHVEIANQSTTDWASQGRNPVHISYHWFDTEGNIIVFDGERTKFLGSRLPAGQSTQQVVRVVAPSVEGTYQIALRLVEEGIRWFEAPTFVGEVRTIAVRGDNAIVSPFESAKPAARVQKRAEESQRQRFGRRLRHLRSYVRSLW